MKAWALWLVVFAIPVAWFVYPQATGAWAWFIWLGCLAGAFYRMGQANIMKAYGGLPRPKER